MREEQNLAAGSVTKKLLLFAWPLLLAQLLQAFYSVVDMLVVGNLVGEAGLAAVSNASMLSFIIQSVGVGVTLGGTVLTAQDKGAGDEGGQRETAGTLLIMTLAAALAVTVIGLLAYRPVFRAMRVPAASMEGACAYMRVICCGTVLGFGYNGVSALMKGRGDSRGPLLCVAAAAAVNTALDLLLVGPLGLGTAGAAWATVLAQGASLAAALRLWRQSGAGSLRKRVAVRPERAAAILKIGLPAAVQMAVVNIAYLLMTGMLNEFGVSAAAASGVGLKVNTLAGMPCWAVGQAVTAMAGQSMGADNRERVRRTVRAGLGLSGLATAAAVLLVQLWARPIILLFGAEHPETLQAGVLYLRTCCGVNSLVYAAMYTLDSFAIGVGAAHVAMGNALLDAVAVRLPVSWLLAFAAGLGVWGAYLGQALSPILPALVGFWYFRNGGWERKGAIRPGLRGGRRA